MKILTPVTLISLFSIASAHADIPAQAQQSGGSPHGSYKFVQATCAGSGKVLNPSQLDDEGLDLSAISFDAGKVTVSVRKKDGSAEQDPVTTENLHGTIIITGGDFPIIVLQTVSGISLICSSDLQDPEGQLYDQDPSRQTPAVPACAPGEMILLDFAPGSAP